MNEVEIEIRIPPHDASSADRARFIDDIRRAEATFIKTLMKSYREQDEGSIVIVGDEETDDMSSGVMVSSEGEEEDADAEPDPDLRWDIYAATMAADGVRHHPRGDVTPKPWITYLAEEVPIRCARNGKVVGYRRAWTEPEDVVVYMMILGIVPAGSAGTNAFLVNRNWKDVTTRMHGFDDKIAREGKTKERLRAAILALLRVPEFVQRLPAGADPRPVSLVRQGKWIA